MKWFCSSLHGCGAPKWVREFGLNIGNEAVFTRESYGREGCWAWICSASPWRCKTSEEALNLLTDILERYGQEAAAGMKNLYLP